MKAQKGKLERGRILKLFRERGFGFITPEGEGAVRVYFHRYAIVDGTTLDDMTEGDSVSYTRITHAKGLRAINVTLDRGKG